MMMAALEGGLTFQKGLGAVHALSHPLGGLADKRLHHGMLNGVFLPHVLRFNRDACPEKIARMAQVIGLADPGVLPEAFAMLVRELGLPGSLHEMGVTRAEAESVRDAVLRDHSCATNLRPLGPADVERLLSDAY
jgi:alcohol dehydrogenase class IV